MPRKKKRANLREEIAQINQPIDFKKALQEEEVLRGLVVMNQPKLTADDEPSLVLEAGGKKVIVLKSEVGVLPKKQNITELVGRIMTFVVTSYNEETGMIFGSHKKASQIKGQKIVEAMENGEYIKGIVRHLEEYGAYITVAEGVYGLLRNKSFSDSAVCVKDVLKPGQVIEVGLTKTSETGLLILHPKEKYVEDGPQTLFEDLVEGQYVYGVVRNLRTDKVFVTIATGLEIMTSIPPNMILHEGQKVRAKITKINVEERLVRGKIEAVLGE